MRDTHSCRMQGNVYFLGGQLAVAGKFVLGHLETMVMFAVETLP